MATTLLVQKLTPEAFEPYGWVIGERPSEDDPTLYATESTIFSTAHIFDPGEGGEAEMVWVNYGPKELVLTGLESHRLTEQSFTALGGSFPVIHVVAPPPDDPMAPDVAPEMSKAAAFLIDGTKGVCLRRAAWHAHFSLGGWANFLMMTRRSTTDEIEKAMRAGGDMSGLRETAFWAAPEGKGLTMRLS